MVRSKNPELHSSSTTSPHSSSGESSSDSIFSSKSPSPSPSKSLTPSPPSKTPTKTKKHTRPRSKVQKPPAKKTKVTTPTVKKPTHISIKEPIVTRSKTKPVKGRGKAVASASSSSDDSSTDEEFRQVLRASKEDDLRKKSMSKGGTSAGPSMSAAPTVSQTPDEEEETEPPEGFNTSTLKPLDKKVYDDEFAHRKFCPVVYVDLDYLHSHYNIDLRGYLNYYQPWLSSHLLYSPEVVRNFYSNMTMKNVFDKKTGSLIEERIETNVRGQSFKISPNIINHILGYENPPPEPEFEFTPAQVYSLLRPGEEMGPLSFKPVQMPIIQRILFYIYTRSIVNKSKNFTHFAHKDYYMMASLLSGHQRNVGEMIFEEMRRFRFSSTLNTYIPLPQIVSLILRYNKIWYLEKDEKVRIPRFGMTQLHRMGISLPLRTGRELSSSSPDEAQSSAPQTPSFIGASIQNYVGELITKAVHGLRTEIIEQNQEIKHQFEQLVLKMEQQVKKLVDDTNHNFGIIIETQAAHSRRMDELEALIRGTSDIPGPSTSTIPTSTSPPEEHPILFSYTDPHTSEQVDVTLGSPDVGPSAPQPSSPPFSPAPIDPSTALVPYTSSSDITFPVPPSDADKTGEKKEE